MLTRQDLIEHIMKLQNWLDWYNLTDLECTSLVARNEEVLELIKQEDLNRLDIWLELPFIFGEKVH